MVIAENDRRFVALAIGVSDAEKTDYLSGAINGARGFHAWAQASGYESRLLIDDDAPITLLGLKAALELLLAGPKPIHRLLLYFAGHGVIRGAEDTLWLLSHWYTQMRAVDAEHLKRRLSMHGIQQIGIFSDACRSLPKTMDVMDLAGDPVLDRGPRQLVKPAMDKFIATQDGAETFMVPGASPADDRCVFTGVLLEGLWGTKPSAFSTVRSGMITSSSLGRYLESEVPIVAKRYECIVLPTTTPAFPEDDNVYFGGAVQPVAPPFPAWPVAGVLTRPQGLKFRGRFGDTLNDGADVPAVPRPQSAVDQLIGMSAPRHFETGAGFAIEGASALATWTPPEVAAEKLGDRHWWRLRTREQQRLIHAAQTLIEVDDGRFVSIAAIPGFVASMVCDRRGAAALVYRPMDYRDDGPQSEMLSLGALRQMEAAGLRANTALNLAVNLRQSKHQDPMLGVVSAYLYESLADVDSVRRMARYYTFHSQPIPYDIALLADLEARLDKDGVLRVSVPAVAARAPRTEEEARYAWVYDATPAGEGEVAGRWPMLRQGWAFLDDMRAGSALIWPGLPDLTAHLTTARFTTFNQAGGLALVNLFGLVREPA